MEASLGEFVGRCAPNAHVIRGLDLWHYVELKLDATSSSNSEAGLPSEEQTQQARLFVTKLQDLQSILMEKGILACVDRSELQVWAFTRSAVQLDEAVGADTDSLPLLDGTRATVTHRGQLVTADLLRDAHGATMRAFKPNQSAQSSIQVDAASVAHLKTHEIAAKHYRLLILAIMETFSFRLCVYKSTFLPIAFGLLAVRPSPEPGVAGQEVSREQLPVDIVRISPVLTAHGSLIVSPSPVADMELYRITADTGPGPVYLGPCGAWVFLSSGRYEDTTGSRTVPGDAFKGDDGKIWRRKVQAFLARKGVVAPDPEQSEGWAAIQIFKASRFRLAWPVFLCYAWDVKGRSRSIPEQWRRWYDTSADKDSLDAALNWLWADHGTDQGADSVTDAMQQDDDEITSSFNFDLGASAQSPAFIRQTQYHDNNAAMIYPTPPDGMPVNGALDFSQDIYVETSTQDSVRQMQSNAAAPVDHDTGAELQEDSGVEMTSSPTYADDLFGDGSDMPDEPDVTDADFSFFDEGSLAKAIDATMTDIDQRHSDAHSHQATQDDHMMVDQKVEDVLHDSLHEGADASMHVSTEKHVTFEEQIIATAHSADEERLSNQSILLDHEANDDGGTSQSTNASLVTRAPPEPSHDESTPATSRPFNAVNFNAGMMQSDSKYSGQGRFSAPSHTSTGNIPREPPYSSTSAHQGIERSSPWKSKHTQRRPRGSRGQVRSRSSSSEDSSISSSDEEMSDNTDDEDTLHANTRQGQDLRRLQSNEDNDSQTGGSQSDTTSADAPVDIEQITSMILSDFFDGYKPSSLNGPSLHTLESGHKRLQFATRQSDSSTAALQEIASIAKAVAEHSGSAPLINEVTRTASIRKGTTCPTPNTSFNVLRPALVDAVEVLFSELGSTEDMASFAVLDPTPILSSPRLGAPSPGAQSRLLGEAIFDIPAPYVKVSKSDGAWCMASTSIPFWDVLGLGPVNGSKNVVAHCVIPGTARLIQAAQDFLQTAKSSYENARLGLHRVGGLVTEFQNNGVIPCRAANIQSESDALGQIEETCVLLANVLGRKGAQTETLLVYIVNPFTSAEAFAGLCRCCATLERRYYEGIGASEETAQSKIVSVIVPSGLVSSDEAPVFVPSEAMAVFARNVYDRILPPTSKRSLAISTAHAIELEEPARTRIPFELTEKASADPLLEGCSMHLAYMTSPDGKWVTAAWTNDTGTCQDVSALCIEGRSFGEAAYELWLTTIEIIRARRVSWRLFVTSGAPMSIQEQRLWLRLATMLGSPQAPVRATLTLLSVNVAPSLELSAPATASEAHTTPQSLGGFGSYTTPASTPGPVGASPNPTTPAMNASTPTSEAVPPAADADPSTRLYDATDDSWGIILSHALTAVADPLIYAPARASGYLAKRRSADDQDAPILLEINLIYCADKIEPGESALIRNDKTLRQVLVSYRGLSLLARLRGVQGSDCTIPWHIAAARRGAEALARGMVLPSS